jgi:dipeptidyl aminopeptidase/acylaminoacyl peptidase
MAISLPLHAFEQRCMVMENSLPSGFLTGGTVILKWEYEWRSFALMALTAEDEQPRTLPDLPEIGSPGITSPDGKWLAYISDDLIILSSDGTVAETRTRNDDWTGIQGGWLDNERILFQSLSMPEALHIINPFTDQEEIFSPELKDRYEYDREWSGWFVWKFVPDPTLTRIVYMRAYFEGQKRLDPPALLLVDVESEQTLWELKRFSPGDRHMPVWSPDGSQLAVLSDDYQSIEDAYHWEVFTVNRDGKSKHWLDVKVGEDTQPFNLLGENLAWSPDGRYITFYSNSLYILDTEKRQVFDLCIPYATQTATLIYPHNTITWSPDSRQILFQRGDAPAVVIDLESNRAAPLVEDINIRPIGWLRAEP